MTRHFLTGAELTPDELEALLARAAELKRSPVSSQALSGLTIALIFAAPSTRTRVSFEAGMFELGGHPMVLRSDELQITRGESIRDTAYVLSRHVAAIGIRTGPDQQVAELARHATVPVFNMLTAGHHPCQALADLLTLREAFGELRGLKLAYVGDGNNVARSLAVVGALAGVEVRIAAPDGYQLEPVAGAVLTSDPRAAVDGADAVYTDVWVSMSDDPANRRAPPRSAGAVPDRRPAARPRGSSRDRAALPPGAPRRGDHGDRAVRRPPAHLGPGGESPPRPEGAARAAGRWQRLTRLDGFTRRRVGHTRSAPSDRFKCAVPRFRFG